MKARIGKNNFSCDDDQIIKKSLKNKKRNDKE